MPHCGVMARSASANAPPLVIPAGIALAVQGYMTRITTIAIPFIFAACIAMEPDPVQDHPVAVETAEPTDDVPCDLLKGPPVLPAIEPTPIFRYAEEFDLVVGYAEGSPFLALSPGDYQIFRDSMRFNDAGQLTSYRYDVLKAALSPDEFAAAEAALGRRAKDHVDYDCIKRATCQGYAGRVCMSAC